MTTIDLTPRLRAAADYIREHGWTTGTEKNDAGQVCLTGAIRYCAPQNGDEYLIREVLRKRDRAENWNDSEATKAQVIKYLATAEVTDADLADTFGPQWEQIVALVRSMFSVTPRQWDRLAAAGDAARDAAWAAAWGAAWGAAGGAAGAAARAAAGDAAWAAGGAAARDAARDAARAAATRDLIGQHGYTQEHYDILSGPWRKTIGKIHPDDLDIYEADEFESRA